MDIRDLGLPNVDHLSNLALRYPWPRCVEANRTAASQRSEFAHRQVIGWEQSQA
jgi:hypothetical protein